jgi:hypothetical protein
VIRLAGAFAESHAIQRTCDMKSRMMIFGVSYVARASLHDVQSRGGALNPNLIEILRASVKFVRA